MHPTRLLRAGHYQPMIKFIGKHRPPPNVSHAPQVHPAAPSSSLPDSFASYRAKAQSHGPLGGGGGRSSDSVPLTSTPHGASASSTFAGQSQVPRGIIGAHTGRSLGSVKPAQGVVMDRSQLPKRFGRLKFSEEEVDAVESGGATLF